MKLFDFFLSSKSADLKNRRFIFAFMQVQNIKMQISSCNLPINLLQ